MLGLGSLLLVHGSNFITDIVKSSISIISNIMKKLKTVLTIVIIIPVILYIPIGMFIISPFNFLKFIKDITITFHNNNRNLNNQNPNNPIFDNLLNNLNPNWTPNSKPPIINQRKIVHKVYLNTECLICREPFNGVAMDIGCGHLYCESCINVGIKCAMCNYTCETRALIELPNEIDDDDIEKATNADV